MNKLVIQSIHVWKKLKRLEKDWQHVTTATASIFCLNFLEIVSRKGLWVYTFIILSCLDHLHYIMSRSLAKRHFIRILQTDFYTTNWTDHTQYPLDAFVQFHASFSIFLTMDFSTLFFIQFVSVQISKMEIKKIEKRSSFFVIHLTTILRFFEIKANRKPRGKCNFDSSVKK